MKSDKMIQTSATGILLVAAIFAISMTLAVPHDVSAQMCGDFNGDDKIDIGDVTGILYYLYDGDIPPVSADSADIDSIAGITNHDLQFLINYLFLLQGAPYCPPYPPDSILPITQDTLEIRNSAVPPDSSRARVELWLKSQDDLLAVSLPFQYACATSAIFLDSISFVGSAYQGYLLEGDTIYPGESMGAFGITSTTQLSVDYGLLASLWFSITPSADTQYILIDTTTTPPGNITIFSRMTVNTGNKLIAFIPTIVGLGARTVQSVTPGQNELGVAVSTDIEVRFWYDMDDATITDTTFVAYGSVSGPHDGVISYDAPSRTATLTPAVDFRPGEEVTVILSTGIHYQSGLPIDSGFVWSFRTAVGGGSGIYDSYMSSTVGSGLMAVCACDIEGDGDNDLVFAGAGDSVIVLRNEGDGIFQPPAAYGTGVSPGFVVTADLDRDGDMDAVTANYTGASVSVLKNDGTGSFESPDDISVAAACYVVTVDDFDGDGDIDIAASTGAGNVAIIKNNGDATFEPSQYYSSGGTTLHGMCSADLDGDGDIDIATANYTDNDISILRNNGAGAFSIVADYPAGNTTVAVEAADLNGDGNNDLLAVNAQSSDITVFMNDGDGSFGAVADYGTGYLPHFAAVFDIDCDGDLDIIAPAYGADSVSILRNSGDGTFRPYASYPCAVEGYKTCAADFDGDGDGDLAIPSSSALNMTLLWNSGDYLVQNTSDAGTSSLRWAIEQSNGDPDSDTILFGVSGMVALQSPLPLLSGTKATVIMGSTAPEGAHSFILDGSALPEGNGLEIGDSSNVIEGLTIRNFPENGIAVVGGACGENTISNNLIYANDLLGIDLGGDGITVNDPGDGDTGPNDLLNYPETDSIVSQPDESYMIYGRAAVDAVIEFFVAHPADDSLRMADSSGHGEAWIYVGQTTASPSGEFVFHDTETGHFSVLTSTATDPQGNTSEMSENFMLLPAPLTVVAYVYTPPTKSGLLPQNGVNIIIEDPNGDRFGRDSLNATIDDIPGDQYYAEGPGEDTVVIPDPILGEYAVYIVGESGSETGTLYASIIRTDGSQQCILVIDAETPASGTFDSYEYNYDETGDYLYGDANGDSACNVSDAVYIINFVFKGGPQPVPESSGDADCSGTLNVSDAVYIINYVFKGGNPPCSSEP